MFDPVRICALLNEEGVEYVVIGGFAAVIHGSSLPTRDLDVVPARAVGNLEALGRALTRMGAMIRTGDEPVPAPMDGPFLAGIASVLNLATDFGDVDVVVVPAGEIGDYDGWRLRATTEQIDEGVEILVGSLEDVIDSKRAANRLKDQRDLPYLESLRDEIRGRTAPPADGQPAPPG